LVNANGKKPGYFIRFNPYARAIYGKRREFGTVPLVLESFNPIYRSGNVLIKPDDDEPFRSPSLTHYDAVETFNSLQAPRWYPPILKDGIKWARQKY
jgi:hypothetical protein